MLKRNLLLTLAEAEFFRLRWSQPVLDETEKAIAAILLERGIANAAAEAASQRARMEAAFEEAMVTDFERLMGICGLPDPKDAHVLAAALKTQAATLVTDNLKDFPQDLLNDLNIEARSTDAFLADTIALDAGRAVAAIRRMRTRFKRPEMSPERLLIAMEAAGLTETVDMLRPHQLSL
ncbi:PIN domain-containing protein [Sphingomonas panacisoli]|uniref:PIN domain-containing protein n=1 Tax=Sphingomonas panacisoli TaxID=1813879 RepID=UPI001EFF78F5|nr:PIN domain-containing protein [Sphingomonas panacisoli]